MTRPQAYIFDVFGTLVDWRSSIARQVAPLFQSRKISVDPDAFADYWRSRYQPAMQRIRQGNRGYLALDQLHLENLTDTLDHFDLTGHFSDEERKELNRLWERLDPWPDVAEGLLALKEHSIIAPCSNGSIALMTRLARYGHLPFDCILGADIARDYKPKPIVYQASCKALRLSPESVMMVAAHNDDLHAARKCGLQTAFIARPTEYGPGQDSDLQADAEWDRVVSNLIELAW